METKRWTKEEIEYLVNNYEKTSYRKLSEYLCRSLYSVQAKLKRLEKRLDKKELKKRRHEDLKKRHGDYKGEKNPHWKGGISRDSYKYKKIQKERYPERVKAREMVHDALKRGYLKKTACEKCGHEITVAHHTDYSKPLDVVWLCRQCHRKEHNGRY